MKRKIIIIIIFSILFIFPVQALDLVSKKAILVNLNEDKILIDKDSNSKAMIASLTKIITAITVIDNKEDLNEEVVITYNMLKGLDGYAKVGLKVGDKLTYEELLYALMLPSGADAAQALAIATSNSIEEFSNLMNEEVKKIGVNNSHFTNPVGMDDIDNYSTAYDLYKILEYSLNNKTFKTIFEARNYNIKSINKKIEKTIVTASKYYNIDSSIIKGEKTGYTYLAGRCLASTATIDDINYLMINLNAPTNTLDYLKDPINTYEYYKKNYGYKIIKNKDDIIYRIKIKNSKQKYYDIVLDKNIELYLSNDVQINDIDIKYTGIELLTRKNKLNEKIGIIDFVYNDEILYTYDVYLNKDIKYYNFYLIISIPILILSISLLFIKKIK